MTSILSACKGAQKPLFQELEHKDMCRTGEHDQILGWESAKNTHNRINTFLTNEINIFKKDKGARKKRERMEEPVKNIVRKERKLSLVAPPAERWSEDLKAVKIRIQRETLSDLF
jgi:hypothetical protein